MTRLGAGSTSPLWTKNVGIGARRCRRRASVTARGWWVAPHPGGVQGVAAGRARPRECGPRHGLARAHGGQSDPGSLGASSRCSRRAPAPVDANLLLLPELIGDVCRGDRAEERTGRPRIRVEAKLELLKPLGDRARLVDRLRLVARALGVAPLELAHEPGCRGLGKTA